MGRVTEAVKKAVTKKPKVVEEEIVEVSVPTKCTECNGRGLLDADNLCVVCDGSGQITT